MDETNSIREEIRQYVVSEFLPGELPANLKDDTPLRTSGVLDSMATLRLVSFVEERFGIEVEAHEAGVENFDRIQDVSAFILRKRVNSDHRNEYSRS
jgi:acyl carrier protein